LAEKEKLEADKRALEAARQKEIDDKLLAERMEKEKAEAAEKARIEAEAKAKRDAEDERLAKIEEEEEAKRLEELKPDKEKLLSFADVIRNIPVPSLKNKAAQNLADAAKTGLLMTAKNLTEAVEKMGKRRTR
jgi:hypothetical protein